jgi:hypothetical protein
MEVDPNSTQMWCLFCLPPRVTTPKNIQLSQIANLSPHTQYYYPHCLTTYTIWETTCQIDIHTQYRYIIQVYTSSNRSCDTASVTVGAIVPLHYLAMYLQCLRNINLVDSEIQVQILSLNFQTMSSGTCIGTSNFYIHVWPSKFIFLNIMAR